MHAIQTSGNCIRNISSRPVCRRRGRRAGRPAPLCRAAAPVVELPPGIHLPAAQVQDRGDRVARRTARRCGCTISASSIVKNDAGELGAAVLCRRRHGPHPDDRAADPRFRAARPDGHLCRGVPARLQPPRPARQQVQGADQDPRPRTGRGGIHAPGRGGIRAPAGPGHRTARSPNWTGSRAIFSRPAVRDRTARNELDRSDPDFALWVDRNCHRRTRQPGYVIADDQPEAGRRHSRRCYRRPDAT